MEESVIVPIYKKGDETDFSNYRGISVLPNMYKILFKILLSGLTPYIQRKLLGDHQCGFQRNRSTADRIFWLRRILENNGNTVKQYIQKFKV